jgi:hypothetical protein
LTLDSNSTYQVVLNSDSVYSQTRAGGAINLAGATLSLTLSPAFTPTGKDQFTILKNTGSSAITGTFAGLAEGATVTVSGQTFQITYKGGAGNDVVLTHLINTTTTISPVTTSQVFGQSVALTATVTTGTSGFGNPTGTIDFESGTTDLGKATLSASGSATLNTTALAAKPNSITAVYSGDTNFAASSSTAITVTVAKASTTTTLTTSPNPSVANQQVTLTARVAAVSPGSGTPTGTVQFFNGSTSVGSGTLANGVAVLATTSLPVGTDAITADYSGDTNFTSSVSTGVNQQVNSGTTVVTLSVSNANPFGFQAVTLTAIVVGNAASGMPTGTVTFFDIHGTNLGSKTLTPTTGTATPSVSTGTATLSVSTLPVGPESITAVYSGDSNFAGGTSPAVAMVVGSRSELFVNQVYLDATGVPSGELEAYWVALINGGYPPKLVSKYIVNTLPARTAAVNNSYETLLRRPATLPEVTRALTSKNPTLNALDANLLGSKEYYQTQGGGTINGFLTALAEDWLGTSFSPRTQARLAGQLRRGVSRHQVAQEVISSPSGVTAELDNLYERILGRPASRKEVSRFGPLIKRGQVSQVAVALFGSVEFTKKYVDII